MKTGKRKTVYRMTNDTFLIETQDLLSGIKNIPSKAYCDKFFIRLKDGKYRLEKKTGDFHDYSEYPILGYALLNDFHRGEEAQEIANKIKIFHWVQFYTAIENDDIDTLEETVIEIFDLENKWSK